MRIGILALQGDVVEHCSLLRSLGVETVEVRTVGELGLVDGLVIPGGESTTLLKLMSRIGFDTVLVEKVKKGFPVFGTCAGLIVLSSLGLIDISFVRNGYGRQSESFEASIDGMHVAFIRAPIVKRVGKGVDVLHSHDGKTVCCKSGNVLVASFHPEVFSSKQLHKLFVGIVKDTLK